MRLPLHNGELFWKEGAWFAGIRCIAHASPIWLRSDELAMTAAVNTAESLGENTSLRYSEVGTPCGCFW